MRFLDAKQGVEEIKHVQVSCRKEDWRHRSGDCGGGPGLCDEPRTEREGSRRGHLPAPGRVRALQIRLRESRQTRERGRCRGLSGATT